MSQITTRLYYTDATRCDFTATVLAVDDERRRIVLDQTAFYPTSGGQRHDTGTLGDGAVVDVIDEDARIVHVCAQPVTLSVGDLVDGHVNWERRYHHMQQHSGQHLLSALLVEEYGWPTVSVHFGDDTNTLDVTATSIDADTLMTIETRANRLAASSRAITISVEDAATATGLRKASKRLGALRIVTIQGLDRSACGGTHVAHTGEIGAILLRRAERTKGHMRLEFVCGLRAVARARLDASLLSAAARAFSASPEDLPALVDAQQRRLTELERERRRMMADLALYDARARWSTAPVDAAGLRRIAVEARATPLRETEPLVQALIGMGACVVVATSAEHAGIMLGASPESGVDAGQTLRTALQSVGGRGGGSPRLAQGSAPDSAALDAVVKILGFNP